MKHEASSNLTAPTIYLLVFLGLKKIKKFVDVKAFVVDNDDS